MQRVLHELKERKLVQWALAYLATAWVLWQAINLLGTTYDWPPGILRALPVLLAGGFGATLVLAWYHGERGEDQVTKGEVALLCSVIVATGAAVTFVSGGTPAQRAVPVFEQAAIHAPTGPRIAVLPFANIGGDAGDDFLARGLTEEVLTYLSKLSNVRITASATARAQDPNRSAIEIGRELGVTAVLQGGVRRAGQRVRITAQLLDVSTGEPLWADAYDRELDLEGFLALQIEIAERITMPLRVELAAVDRQRLPDRLRPVHAGAYEAYLRGRAGEGIDHLLRAVEIDPEFAPAWAALSSQAFAAGFNALLPPAVAFELAEERARRALALDSTLGWAQAVLGLVSMYRDWNWREAERRFQAALLLNRNDPALRHHYAHYLLIQGRREESLAETRLASELDPFNAALTACSGWHHLPERNPDGAMDQALRALRIQPNHSWADQILGWAFLQREQLPEAIASFSNGVTNSSRGTQALASLAHAIAVAGHVEYAHELLEELKDRAGSVYVSPYDIAGIYAGLGDRENAFHWLRQAVEERSAFLPHIAWDPRFDPIRDDAVFREVLAPMNLPSAGHRFDTAGILPVLPLGLGRY
jgi:TolB-like protein/Flp pilus assembly protein TadD